MSDINNFVVAGTVSKIAVENKGFTSITIKSVRTTPSKIDELPVPVIIWGERANHVKSNDYVVATGYVNARVVQRKDGSGSFPSLSLVATNIKVITASQQVSAPQQSTMPMDDEIPF